MQMWTEDTAGGPASLVITPSVESLRGKTNKAAYFVQMTEDAMFNSHFHGDWLVCGMENSIISDCYRPAGHHLLGMRLKMETFDHSLAVFRLV